MLARTIWSHVESVHAVTYFAPESTDAAKAAGLRGFWMGYFGFRASPLGAVSPSVVEATFANFAPDMVRRVIPDAWRYASPGDLVAVRARSAATALRRLSPRVEDAASRLNDDLATVIAHAASIGRPLFAANRDVVAFGDPVERFWQYCTALREHRGDGHVAALAAAGIDGCEAHLLIAAEHGWDPDIFFASRGWSIDHQHAARAHLADRGLLADGALTPAGSALRTQIEAATDAQAMAPYDQALSPARLDEVVGVLAGVSADVVDSGAIPFPNPMGLPKPDAPAP